MRDIYLKKADENLPLMHEHKVIPDFPDTILQQDDEIIIDLGNHYVGYFSFRMNYVDYYIDAPVRLCVRFCETKRELEDDFSTYHGSLCSSWLQEEIMNLDFPKEYEMPRRYAARYIKIRVLAAPKKLVLSDLSFRAVTSADLAQLVPLGSCEEKLRKIDTVAVNTLKNCMQRVFEDGPKRDRRLWIGDLRLEALTNYYTFQDNALVRRCLYLFAAASVNEKGFLPGYIYENPDYVSGEWYLEDYALLFVASACDYYSHTKDEKTFYELYPVIKNQMEAMHRTVGEDGIVTVADGCDAFIDWCQGLAKNTSLHGVYLYVLRLLTDVLEQMGHEDAAFYRKRYEKARSSALTVLYNEEKQQFINKKDNEQYSVHSTVWMILGGVVNGKKAERLLLEAIHCADSVKPFTPYMHHYAVEALVQLGLFEEASEYIKNYWGGMTELGADTFYEVYVPDDLDFSPYGDRMINSMCHAWSCTPSYFIRKYITV